MPSTPPTSSATQPRRRGAPLTVCHTILLVVGLASLALCLATGAVLQFGLSLPAWLVQFDVTAPVWREVGADGSTQFRTYWTGSPPSEAAKTDYVQHCYWVIPLLGLERCSGYTRVPAACDPPIERTRAGIVSRPCDTELACVTPELCVASEHGAANVAALDRAGITHVVSAIDTCRQRTDRRPCLDLELADTVADLGVVDALRLALTWVRPGDPLRDGRDTRVLVHCAAGVSRSATIALAYMMEAAPEATYDEALAALRRVRPVAEPNGLFELTLRLWHAVRALEPPADDFGAAKVHREMDQVKCGLRHALTPPDDQPAAADGEEPRPPCAPSTYAALDRVYAEHGHRLPPYPQMTGGGALKDEQ